MLHYYFGEILLVISFSASCVYRNILCIIGCLQSESAIMLETCKNFQISGRQTALTSMQLNYKIWASSLPEKAQDANDLWWHLIDL